MGHFCILVSLRCRAWQISTAVELELPDSETLWIRSLLHTILPWMLNTDEMPSSPWGKLRVCPGKSTATQRDFSATAQSLQKPEEPVRQIPAVFEGLEGQELEQSLGGKNFPAQPLFISSEPRPCRGCWADTTCPSHTQGLRYRSAELGLITAAGMRAVYSRIYSYENH